MSEPLQLTTLGEALVVMDPVSRGPLRHVSGFEKNLGGAELNVAVGLSRLGHRAGWAGRLGDEEFGKEILAFARGEGVDVSRTSLDSEAPTGLYFKEWRALGQLRVYYYRAGSAASLMRFDQLDLEYLLCGEILHLTGITAALSESCHDLIERLLSVANERGVTVSFDVNVRRLLFGGSDPGSLQEARQDIRAETVVVHRAEGAFAVEGGGVSEMAAYPVDAVDTVGAGDAFVAGFLSGRLRRWSTEECLDMANACGACAVTVPGDLKGLPTAEEALALRRGRPGVER